ncbi:hypothetical protein C8Q80DRAFT_1117540 [Daedaleopsis nitida]|nr:hypothetical protein C8Q80DRAFT_1117540 [Daedaleopsis nitida]
MNPPASAVYPAYMVVPMDHKTARRRRPLWHYLAGVLFIISATGLLRLGNKGHFEHTVGRVPYSKHGPSSCFDPVNWTIPADGSADDSSYHASTSMIFPIDSQEIRFVADGALQYGDFEVSQDNHEHSDSVIVNVDVAYSHPDALDEATVCRTHPDESKWGLAIFTPHWSAPHLDRSLRFRIHLRLPAATPGKTLRLNALRTHLPLFTHRLPALADSVYFDSIKLKSENAPIQADSLRGNRIWFSSRNGVIEGNFTASDLLDLHTANAHIDVHAELINGNASTTRLFLTTSNARINGEITLISNTSAATEGNFHVVARSLNAPLKLAFEDAPVDSSLTVTASTSNSPARVALHSTFEGVFDLMSSSIFRPEVDLGPVDDPAERGRTRQVRFSTQKGTRRSGSVSWGKGDGATSGGRVVVETTNAPLSLVL